MKERNRVKTGILLITLWFVWCAYGSTLRLDMKKELELGKKGEMFYQVNSVCEDDEENIYLLDSRAYKVRKFSKEGKELLSFGSKGEGPGEFKSPSRIYYSKESGIIVTEMMNEASIFTKEGTPVRKVNLSTHFGMLFSIRYLGNDIYYAQQRRDNFSRRQVLVDSKGSMVNENLYAGGSWEVSIGNTRYSIVARELSPWLVCESYKGRGAVARTDKYEVKLINSKGKEVALLQRDIPKDRLTKKDKAYFIQQIRRECKNWPPAVAKKFEKEIPPAKMYFYNAFPTSQYVYVLRVKKETANKDDPFPVDVFDMKGSYLGEVKIPKIPLFMSDTYIYFMEVEIEDDDEVVILVKNSYRLIK